MNELQAVFAQENNQKRILPILHDITIEDIKRHWPLMADRYFISSDNNMEFIVGKILEAVTEKKYTGTGNNYSDAAKKKTMTGKMLLTPVLLPLEAQRVVLEKLFPDLKTVFKNKRK